MPRLDISMGKAQISALFAERRTSILASYGKDGYPHLVPMWHLVVGDDIYFTSYRKAQKVKNIERDPRVAFLVETGYEYFEQKGVMIKGTCRIVTDPAEDERLIAFLNEREPASVDEARTKEVQVKAHREGKRVFFRLEPEKVISWDFSKIPKPAPPTSPASRSG